MAQKFSPPPGQITSKFVAKVAVFMATLNLPGYALAKKERVKPENSQTKKENQQPDSKEASKEKRKSKRIWNISGGFKAGLLVTPLPALGFGLQSRPDKQWGGSISWENGSVSPDASTFYTVDPNSGWSIDDLNIQGTRLTMEGRWFFSRNSWLGMGFFQKNLTVRVEFSHSGTNGSNFKILGSLLSRGLSFSYGSQWHPWRTGLLEVTWLGIDWPFWSETLFEGGNDTLAVSVDESFFDGQAQTKQLISSLRNFPLPSALIIGASYKFY